MTNSVPKPTLDDRLEQLRKAVQATRDAKGIVQNMIVEKKPETKPMSSNRFVAALKRVQPKLSQASTWRGMALLAGIAGYALSPEEQEAFVLAGLGLAAVIGVFISDA